MGEVVLQTGRIDEEPGATLVDALLDDLRSRYDGEEDADPPDPAELASPLGAFWVAFLDGHPVGCGGFKHHTVGVAEVKRMYVDPAARRAGVARIVLAAIEDEARARGYGRLVLETGVRQPEAIALYRSVGFGPMACWGDYADDARSVCFTKAL